MLHVDQPTDRPVEDDVRRWARERAEMIQGLFIHLLVFPTINGGLFVINALTRGDDGAWWFRWPLLFWGLALVIHIVATVFPVFSDEWVDRKADQLAGRR